MKQTALHDIHLKLNAKMAEHQGWNLPAQYGDVRAEHHAVRFAAGLFDVSHLGRLLITGPGSVDLLQKTFTRNVEKLAEHAALYGLLCNDEGRVLDDAILIHRGDSKEDARYLLVVNAVTTTRILSWLTSHAKGLDVALSDDTSALAQFALQGPNSDTVLEALAGSQYRKIKVRHVRKFTLVDTEVEVSRTGFTGETGYELFIAAEKAADLWNALLEAGKESGILPCGMTARDILRLEMGYPQYGVDMDETRSPYEASLGSFIDLKTDFIGRDALMKIKEEGTEQQLAGFIMVDKSVPRPGSSIFSENRDIGLVTSGALSYSVRKGIGLGYVLSRYVQPGLEIEIESKEREIAAKIEELPFYRKK